MTRKELAAQAASKAARLRVEYGIGPVNGVDPFDLANRLGVVTRLEGLPSTEGMYTPDPKPTIIIGTERPAGRRRYTCTTGIAECDAAKGKLSDLMKVIARVIGPETEEAP